MCRLKHTDRHDKPQICRLKQTERQACRISDVPFGTDWHTGMTKLRYAASNRRTGKQTDMTNLKCAVWKIRTDWHKETQMCLLKQANRRTDMPTLRCAIWNRRTDSQIDMLNLRYAVLSRRRERLTDMTNIRCAFWNRRTYRQTWRTSNMPFETYG